VSERASASAGAGRVRAARSRALRRACRGAVSAWRRGRCCCSSCAALLRRAWSAFAAFRAERRLQSARGAGAHLRRLPGGSSAAAAPPMPAAPCILTKIMLLNQGPRYTAARGTRPVRSAALFVRHGWRCGAHIAAPAAWLSWEIGGLCAGVCVAPPHHVLRYGNNSEVVRAQGPPRDIDDARASAR
jgi:hypothetical protein